MSFTTMFPPTRLSELHNVANDQQQLSLLIEHYAPAIRAYLGIKFPHDDPAFIDDLSQEVALRMLQQPQLFEQPKGRFRYLLMRVAFNHARNARRQLNQRLETTSEFIDDESGAEHDVVDIEHMDAAWAMSLVDLALHDCAGWETLGIIDEHSAAMLTASLREGLGVRALAERFGLSKATCARRIASARQYLIKAIVDQLRAAGEIDEHDGPDAAHDILRQALRA